LNPSVARAFKAAAYQITNKKLHISLSHTYDESQPIIVTIAYRGHHASRHLSNPDLLYEAITNQSIPGLAIRMFNSPNPNITYSEQVEVVESSHVVIAEHGAFQSSLIHMRNHSLLIELRGQYKTTDVFEIFENVASMFGILFSTVTVPSLTGHLQKEFAFDYKKCSEVASIISSFRAYVNAKPYLENISP
jgi:hypothetical protein